MINEAVTRRGALSILRERWWLAVLPMILGAALAGVLALSETKVYEAQAKVQFKDTSFDQLLFGQTVYSQPPSTPTAPIDTDIRQLDTRSVAGAVIATLHLHTTPNALLNRISISEESDSNDVTLAAQDPNPRQAAAIANAWVGSYLTLQKTANQQPLIIAAQSLRAQIASGRAGAASSFQRALQSRLAEIELLTQLQTAGALVTQSAIAPTSPIAPTPKRDTIVGAIVGLALGLILAFAAAVFDRRIKTVEEAEAAYGLPVLAIIPRHRHRHRYRRHHRDDRLGASGTASEESFGMLRSMIGFNSLGRPEPIKTILVTSAGVGDGKSSVSAGLALATASAGRHVLCIDGDMRRPTLPDKLGCRPPSRGLVDALVEGESLRSVLTDVPLPATSARALPSGHVPGSLQMLSVGLAAPNPGQLIESEPFRISIGELVSDPEFDLVVVDSPPVTAVADSAVLAPLCDGVVLVVRSNHSGGNHAKEAMAILGSAKTPILGLVVVGLDRQSGYYEYSSAAGSTNGKGSGTLRGRSAQQRVPTDRL